MPHDEVFRTAMIMDTCGFQLDLLIVDDLACSIKSLLDGERDEVKGAALVAHIKEQLSKYFPDEGTFEPVADSDLPTFQTQDEPNREIRRAIAKKRGTFRPGEGWS